MCIQSSAGFCTPVVPPQHNPQGFERKTKTDVQLMPFCWWRELFIRKIGLLCIFQMQLSNELFHSCRQTHVVLDEGPWRADICNREICEWKQRCIEDNAALLQAMSQADWWHHKLEPRLAPSGFIAAALTDANKMLWIKWVIDTKCLCISHACSLKWSVSSFGWGQPTS